MRFLRCLQTFILDNIKNIKNKNSDKQFVLSSFEFKTHNFKLNRKCNNDLPNSKISQSITANNNQTGLNLITIKKFVTFNSYHSKSYHGVITRLNCYAHQLLGIYSCPLNLRPSPSAASIANLFTQMKTLSSCRITRSKFNSLNLKNLNSNLTHPKTDNSNQKIFNHSLNKKNSLNLKPYAQIIIKRFSHSNNKEKNCKFIHNKNTNLAKMDKRVVTFILGGPGSGKGTQCQRICDEFGFVHLSAGDLLRAERNDKNSKYGNLIETHIQNGEIVPAQITCSLLSKAMDENRATGRYLIDGFPRNKDNLSEWTRSMENVDVKFVLFIDCPNDTCVQRCLQRGQEGSNRSDDNEASLRKRLHTYDADTMPIIDHYKDLGMLRVVNGNRDVDSVYSDIRKIYTDLVDKLFDEKQNNSEKQISDNNSEQQISDNNCDGNENLAVCYEYKSKINMSLKYKLDETKYLLLNFHRQRDEPISKLFIRIDSSIKKQIDQQLNKKQKKSSRKYVSKGDDNINDSKLINDNIKLLTPNEEIISIDEPLFNALKQDNILKINDQAFKIIWNFPRVTNIRLPSVVMVGFELVPSIELSGNCKLTNCKFAWHRELLPRDKNQIMENQQKTCKEQEKMKELINDDIGENWQLIASSFSYTPTQDDLGRRLMFSCIPIDFDSKTNKKIVGFTTRQALNKSIELGPLGSCLFESRHQLTPDYLDGHDEFRIVSYNLLADLYTDSDYSRKVLFSYCPEYALDFRYRRSLLLHELKYYHSDILCLQEVDSSAFKHDLVPAFDHLPSLNRIESQFKGVFHSKLGTVSEGLATFYRLSKFQLIESTSHCLVHFIDSDVDFSTPNQTFSSVLGENENEEEKQASKIDKKLTGNDGGDCNNENEEDLIVESLKLILNKLPNYDLGLEQIRSAIESNEKLSKRFKERKNILQISLLKLRTSPLNESGMTMGNYYLLIANTHLYFHPDADHIRLLQGSIIAKYLDYLNKKLLEIILSKEKNGKLAIIACGDFNSTPDCGFFHLMTQGYVPANVNDWNSNQEEKIINNSLKSDEIGLELSIDSQLRFKSAYWPLPEYTNYSKDFNGCIDYIYHDIENLQTIRTIPLPEHEKVIEHVAIPSVVCPSDHLALIADLKLVDK